MTAPHILVVGMMQTSLRNNIFEISSRVYSTKGLSPSCLTHTGGNQGIKVLVELTSKRIAPTQKASLWNWVKT